MSEPLKLLDGCKMTKQKMTMKKVFRKIHLWLSVPVGIIITLICFSGAMLVYEKELTEALRHDLYFVKEVKAEALPMDELLETVEQTLPDSVSITGVTVFPDSTRAYQVSLSKPRRASVYVDQYTGEVKGRSERLPFFNTMMRLHRWLLGQSSVPDGIAWGKLLTGVSTLFMVFILLTGILMWLTNRNKPLKKSLVIHFTSGWPRFWHDLHVAGGIYATIFLLALALTGLTWSFSWYRTGFYACFGVESSGGGHGSRHGTEQTEGNRDGSGRGANRGEHGGNHGNRGGHGGYHGHGDDGGFFGRGGHRRSPYRHWQEVLDEVAKKNPGYRQITMKSEAAEVIPAGRASLRAADTYTFNRRSGEITDVKPYSPQAKDTKVRGAVYTVHTGSWGGAVTRLLTFLSALIGATLPLTGYYLWIRRLTRKK